MVETIVVIAVTLAALAAGAFAWSYRRFGATRARLIDYLRVAAPEMTVESVTNVGFRAAVLGMNIGVDLATLARSRPAGLPETQWFDRVIEGMRAQIPAPAVLPYPLVEDRMLPLLKPAAYVALFEQYPPALRLAWRPLANGVAVTYVVATADRRTAITSVMLETWGISTDTLHGRSVDNLRKQTAHLLAELGGPRSRYENIDGYDATRILIADLIVPPDVPDPVVAIPEETVLLVATSSDRTALAADAGARHAASARPLSPHVFRLAGGKAVPMDA